MNRQTTGCGAALLLVLSGAAFGAPRASDLKSQLAGLSLQSAVSTNAGELSVGGAVPKVDCNQALDDDANIDQRLEWARSVKECLKASVATLQASAMVSNPAALAPNVSRQNQAAAALAAADRLEKSLSGEREFIGLKWGVGIGYSHGFDDIVDEAEIVDGVVRVKKDLTDQPRVILEFHNYRWCHRNGRNSSADNPIETGCGPFAAVATRDDKVVSGVAAGWMYGWKTGTGDDAQGFSVALGVILDSSGKQLGAGFKDGQPPPDGATSVLLKEKSVASAVLFFTRTF